MKSILSINEFDASKTEFPSQDQGYPTFGVIGKCESCDADRAVEVQFTPQPWATLGSFVPVGRNIL